MLPARRRRLRLAARRPRDLADDPENAQRQRAAAEKMAVYDRLGPAAKAAARSSRFDALDADHVRKRYGCATDFDEPRVDALIAGEIARDDDFYSGAFGPAAAKGI